MGQGRGRDRARGRCQKLTPMTATSPNALHPPDAAEQTQSLTAQDMINRLNAITQRIAEIEATNLDSSFSIKGTTKGTSDGEKIFPPLTAIIDPTRCTCCGLCVDLCPEQAISLNDFVTINSSQCTGCNSCVNECPNKAISLSDAAQRPSL